MKTDWVDGFTVCVIVLEKSLGAAIKNLYFFIGGAWGETRTIRVILYIVDHASMIVESVNQTRVNHIPQLDWAIIWTWGHHSWIQRKLRTSYPVLMSREALDEFTFLRVPNLHEFIVTRGHKQRTIRVKSDAFDWSWVTLHNCAGSRCVVTPNAHSLVSWAWGDLSSAIVNCNISDRALMPYKLVGARIRSETPCEDSAVVWTWNDLFKTGVENSFSDSVFVALKWL